MKVLKFWLKKFELMALLAYMREWMLFREEWKVTYAQLQEARDNSYKTYKLYREACDRLSERE